MSLCVQLRGQRRNITRRTNVDAKPAPARAEDKPATSQTESAALQDLTHEVKLNLFTSQPAFVSTAFEQYEHLKKNHHDKTQRAIIVLPKIHKNPTGMKVSGQHFVVHTLILIKVTLPSTAGAFMAFDYKFMFAYHCVSQDTLEEQLQKGSK